MTPTKKGISIQNAVRRAHAGWPSSHRKMHVLKSVRTSKRLKSTLKNVNFKIWNILENKEKHYFLKVTISEHQYGFLSPKLKKHLGAIELREQLFQPYLGSSKLQSFKIGQVYLEAVLNEGK